MFEGLPKLRGSSKYANAKTDAIIIFDYALELDILIRTLEAEFSLSWSYGKSISDKVPSSRFGFTFIDEFMTDVIRVVSDEAGAQAPTVDLVVSPALFKRGNNDGTDYRTVTCCIKMRVICDASRVCQQNNSFNDTEAGIIQGKDTNSDAKQKIREESRKGDVTHAQSQSSSGSVRQEEYDLVLLRVCSVEKKT